MLHDLDMAKALFSPTTPDMPLTLFASAFSSGAQTLDSRCLLSAPCGVVYADFSRAMSTCNVNANHSVSLWPLLFT